MVGDRSEFIHAFHSFAVERFDVLEDMAEGHQTRANLLRRQAIEHESVVGVGTVRTDDFRRRGGRTHKRCALGGKQPQFNKGSGIARCAVKRESGLFQGTAEGEKMLFENVKIAFQNGEEIDALGSVTFVRGHFQGLGGHARRCGMEAA